MSDAMEAASPGPGAGPGPPPGTPTTTETSPAPGSPPETDPSSSPAPPAPPLPLPAHPLSHPHPHSHPHTHHNGSPTDNSRLVQSGNVTTISVGSPHSPSDKAGKIIKYYPPTCNGNIASDQEGRCSVLVGSTDLMPINDDDITGPDMEISNIHFKGVNMRCKKKLDPNLSEDSRDDFVKEEQERPMSWEGELSDSEMSVVNGSGISLKHEHEESSMEGVQVSVVHNAQSLVSGSGNIHFGDSEERDDNKINVADSRGQSQEGTAVTTASELPLLVDKLLSDGGCYSVTPSNSPVLSHRHLQQSISKQSNSSQSGSVPPNPSPDSAIHSAYSYSSPAQSPVTSRHGSSHGLPSSGFSSPYTPSLSRNNSDASQYGGSQHSSCYSQSYSSVSVSPTQFSPTHSPIQSRHLPPGAASRAADVGSNGIADDRDGFVDDRMASLAADLVHHPGLSAPPGISRQQLINSPCPICGDKISGFHYGIFSCESCKGFFKRTVQNRKNYVCLRGSTCLVTIATRKKCPACRFEKCLRKGMKLEAIREDRTRGGRSTYQISYTLPPTMVVPGAVGESGNVGNGANSASGMSASGAFSGAAAGELQVKMEAPDVGAPSGAGPSHSMGWSSVPSTTHRLTVPPLLQEIMEVEHLWNCNDQETQQKHGPSSPGPSSSSSNSTSQSSRVSSSRSSSSSESSVGNSRTTNGSSESGPDFLNLCNIADHRLYKIVKWCKSLPLFKNISIDDQIILLLNAWCELLLFSCCFRSMSTPGEIRVSLGKSITLAQAKELGLGPCIERMLNLTEHLRRLRVDKFEYVAMKVIILLTSDASDLHESEKVRASQEKALQALQHYTLDHYPDIPSKFGELLLRIPDLQRTCQVGKEMLSIKNKEGEGPSFMLLMELLRGDH